MTSHVDWLGDEVLAKAITASMEAIDVVTQAAADDAKANHWWSNRTGDLEKNTIAEPATTDGLEVRGRFGATLRRGGFYGLFLERRTPWLRPAADRTFPLLPLTIREKARWT